MSLKRSEPSPLIAYTLMGLRRCYMPEHARWSHKYCFDGRAQPNVSVPASDLFYSLNVLLAFSRIKALLAPEPYDVAALYGAIATALHAQPVRHYAYATALWAGAALDLPVPEPVTRRIRALTAETSSLSRWTAQDIGMMLSGAVAMMRHDASWLPLARTLATVLIKQFMGPKALFFDSGTGARRYFATFATQVYSVLGLYHFGEATGDARALDAANACVAALIARQGACGEWPWFHHVPSGRVVDFYEVYSVHQHGMAPAILHHAIAHGVPGARAALVKGFDWILGANVLKRSMLRPELHLIHRSQARAGLAGSRRARMVRSLINVGLGRGDTILPANPGALQLTPEMRSYELAWILWSFGGRDDFTELTHRSEFGPV